jgi:hypothetical protein
MWWIRLLAAVGNRPVTNGRRERIIDELERDAEDMLRRLKRLEYEAEARKGRQHGVKPHRND